LAASRCSKQASLAINSTEKFLTGNVGGGLKWYAPNGIWGQRGDYRFVAAESKDESRRSLARTRHTGIARVRRRDHQRDPVTNRRDNEKERS